MITLAVPPYLLTAGVVVVTAGLVVVAVAEVVTGRVVVVVVVVVEVVVVVDVVTLTGGVVVTAGGVVVTAVELHPARMAAIIKNTREQTKTFLINPLSTQFTTIHIGSRDETLYD